MALDRQKPRNIRVFDYREPTHEIGGLYLANTQCLTNRSFLQMLDIFVVNNSFALETKDGIEVPRDESLIQKGIYYAKAPSDEKIKITQEESSYRCYLRESGTTSEGSSKSRTHSFKEAVRARDNACIISGAQVPQDYDGDLWYGGFEAAHVFPLAFRDDWEAHKLGQVWVKARETEKNATINSVENGLLLTSGVHSLFDTYAVSINPEDYRVMCFLPPAQQWAGRRLDQSFIDHPLRPSDALLSWHYRQAILTNVKSVGQTLEDTDMTLETDLATALKEGLNVGWVEFQLAQRLALHHPESALHSVS